MEEQSKKDQNSKQAEVISFGCRLNSFESEIMKEHAIRAGLKDNVVVFNTCTVTNEAVRQSRQSIRKYKKEHPQTHIIVSGCAAQVNPDEYASMSEVSAIWGNKEKMDQASFINLAKNINAINNDDPIIHVSDILDDNTNIDFLSPENFQDKSRAYVQIQQGCNYFCTFCIIPYARGKSKSLASDTVIEKISQVINQGFNEVILTGVDLTSWGIDFTDENQEKTLTENALTENTLTENTFVGLLKKIFKELPQLKRLRLSSLDPACVSDELIDLFKTEPRLMPFVHLSMQAGEDLTLKRMKRRHSSQDLINIVEKLRTANGNISIGCDIIAGFPTETQEMFNKTCKTVETMDIQWGHVFPYSARHGTPASKMPQVDGTTKKSRAKILRDIMAESQLRFLKKQLNTTTQIVLEDNNKGHSENNCLIHLENISQSDPLEKGLIYDVLITKLIENKLYGKIIL